MRMIAVGVMAAIMLSCPVWAADEGGVQPSTMEKYQKAREKVEAMAGTAAAKYAPEVVENARQSIATAQEGLKSGNEKSTREAVEMAVLQVTLAEVLADERAATEKTEAAKKALEQYEARLAAILAGKGGK